MAHMGFITKEQSQKASGKPHPVDVPEWGGQVGVRKMSPADRQYFIDSLDDLGPIVQANIVHRCCVNPEYDTADEVAALDGDVVKRIFDEIIDISGLNKGVDEAEGNSGPTPSNSSGTD